MDKGDSDAITRLGNAVRARGLDGVVASSFENVCYLTGAVIYTQLLLPQRLAALVVAAEAYDPTLVVCTIEESLTREQSRVQDIQVYEEFQQPPMEVIARVLHEKGLGSGRIGFEGRVLNAQDHQQLRDELPKAKFTPVDDVFDQLRKVKTTEEIKLLAQISLATDKAIRHAYETAMVGSTEIEVLEVIAGELVRSGAEALPFLLLGAGPNTVHVHPAAGDYRLASGDLIVCDVGGRWNGYYSDMARTAVVGEAASHHNETYEALWEVHEDLIDHAKPGVKASDLYRRCGEAIEERGMSFGLSHCGHGLGLGMSDLPLLTPVDDTELEPGMVLAIEPAIRNERGYYHVEDLVEITEDGGSVLSRSADWSRLLTVG